MEKNLINYDAVIKNSSIFFDSAICYNTGGHMSKRRMVQKRRRFIIIVTILLIILSVFLIACLNSRNNKREQEKPDNPGISVPPAKEDKNDRVTKITVEPESYVAHAGEKINVDTFIIKALYESGKTKEIKDNILFTSDSPIIKFQDKVIEISEAAITADSGNITLSYDRLTSTAVVKIFNTLKDNINDSSVVTNENAYDVVVNKNRNLPSDYIPEDLVSLDDVPKSLQNPEINQLRKVAYEALKELFLKAKEEKSFELYARSGYRSYNTQRDLYNAYSANHGQQAADKFSAKPGQSEHQTGLAIDITCASMNFQLDDTFFDKEEGKWVAENAHRFGFIIRYPKGKESITGYQYEPWHLRYVGKALAKEIFENNLTLEEYFQQ